MTQLIAKHRRVAIAIATVSTAVAMSGVLAVIPQVASALTAADVEQLISLGVISADKAAAARALVGGTTPAAPAGACSFTRDLTMGVRGDDVTCLQNYLTSTGHFTYSGGATGYFGSITRSAVSAWQAANSVSPTAGYFGAISRAKYNSVVGGTVVTPTTPTTPGVTPVAGDALQVTKPDQPGDNLAPGNATRIPVTKVTLTAGVKDVTVRSITVERIGLATDSAVDKVLLIGSEGLQVGLNKTLGSNHRAILNEPFVVKAGESKTYTVAFNRPAANEAGNVLSFDVVAIDATSPLTGTLPIRGSQITMNSTLTIGSVDLTRGVNDPGAAATSSAKNIGDTGYKFAALRLTAGAAEDLSVKSISWYQAGSIGAGDLGNVKVILDTTEYPTTVSSDGKYYTAKFGDGVTLTKGNQAEIYVKGDLVGGTNRDIEFQLFRDTDLDVKGKQFGFGVKPGGGTATAGSVANGALSSDTEPAFRGFTVKVGQGTVTVSKSTASGGAAQNIAVNLNDQPLGAFDVDVKGEAVTFSSIVFRVSANANDSSVTEADFTNVTLYDEAGNAVAGPKDGSGTTDAEATITFTDAVEFPVGKKTYFLKGKLSTDFDNNRLVSASSTPSSDWTSGVGRTSGVTITPANVGTVTGNSMTVKTAALTVSIGNTPTAQTVIRGTTAFTFANLIFDVTGSGEDIRITSAQAQLFGFDGNEVKNCSLYDGTVSLTTGSNAVNATGEGDQTFTFDNALIVPKGTIKTIALKCDTLASGDAGQGMWSFSNNETFGATGMTSGNSVTASVASSSVTNIMTMAASGSLAVTLDGSSPAVRMAQAGEEVNLAVFRFTATNEAMDVKQILLQITNTASNTPSDLQKITLWDGATKVGEITATSSDTGLVTTVNGFVVPKNGDKLMTIKGLLSPIGVDEAGRPGHLVSVDLQVSNGGSGLGYTYAVGQGSSQNIESTSASTASAGVRVVRGYPTLTALSVPSNALVNGTDKVLYRFSVASPAGTNGVSLYKFLFNIATTGIGNDLTVTSLKLFAYTSSGFSGGAYSADGQLNSGTTLFTVQGNKTALNRSTTSDFAIHFNPAAPTSADPEAIHIPAGSTYYFELKGTVSGANSSGDSATVQLMGDPTWVDINIGETSETVQDTGFTAGTTNALVADYPFARPGGVIDASTTMSAAVSGTNGNNDLDAKYPGNDFIWSGNSTSTHTGATGDGGPDWYNGFLVPGLPSSGATAQSFSF
ncbi:MAG: peptidoglycan-binding protein [Candidatus Sungbacteria bacterium]|nr:peptidoglycan-binding protein [Candidatus Sungbacteria bacterium]